MGVTKFWGTAKQRRRLVKQPFELGDKVTTGWFTDEENIIRCITSIYRDADCESGWRAVADDGEGCPVCKKCRTCKHLCGEPTPGIDARWFRKA